ncbi:hypothetical protein DFH08DRAFT_891674 [Mycena albidolilacea]|uniref:Uncharacterized protein n=1 Tax=Mycena albidolilacea TaxID=1033008 RepID=A0AAD6ZEB4_9AGAR|nr:hypothetical protein DFH08DRAFT_891674 [Mycena albidolilacea]
MYRLRRPRSRTSCLPSVAGRRSASCRCPSPCKYSCPEINPKINPNSSAEWASTTQKVLASPISAAASTSTPELSSETHFESAMQSVEELRTPDECSAHIEERQAEHERELDLGLESLHTAVDQGLGLSPGGVTWFDVGILPGSGRASPSVYSCDQHSTPHLSRPQSADPSEMKTDSTRGSASNCVSGGSASWAGCYVSGICCVDAKLRLSYAAVNYLLSSPSFTNAPCFQRSCPIHPTATLCLLCEPKYTIESGSESGLCERLV